MSINRVIVRTVLKQEEEKYESVSIIDLSTDPENPVPGDVVKVIVRVINSGTLKTNTSVSLEITKDSEEITLSSESIEIGVAEEKLFTFFWETKGLKEGKYDIMAYAISGNKKASYGPISVVIGSIGSITGFAKATFAG